MFSGLAATAAVVLRAWSRRSTWVIPSASLTATELTGSKRDSETRLEIATLTSVAPTRGEPPRHAARAKRSPRAQPHIRRDTALETTAVAWRTRATGDLSPFRIQCSAKRSPTANEAAELSSPESSAAALSRTYAADVPETVDRRSSSAATSHAALMWSTSEAQSDIGRAGPSSANARIVWRRTMKPVTEIGTKASGCADTRRARAVLVSALVTASASASAPQVIRRREIELEADRMLAASLRLLSGSTGSRAGFVALFRSAFARVNRNVTVALPYSHPELSCLASTCTSYVSPAKSASLGRQRSAPTAGMSTAPGATVAVATRVTCTAAARSSARATFEKLAHTAKPASTAATALRLRGAYATSSGAPRAGAGAESAASHSDASGTHRRARTQKNSRAAVR
eukprot:Amastigsp_a1137_20.p2 type:complete len:402 gc:universal Amastigsp_a1137_20:1695-2900(+)